MLRRSAFSLLLALVLAGLFCAGLARLFVLRYETGDVFAQYSTLRADPLGAKVIYDALDELPRVEVRRNFKPLQKLQPGRPITLVYAGTARESYWTERELQEFDTLVFGGSRAVFTFQPEDRAITDREARREQVEAKKKKKAQLADEKEREKSGPTTPKPKDATDKNSKDAKEDDKETRFLIEFAEMAKRYGFQFDTLPPANTGHAYDRKAVLADSSAPLEPEISWHSALCFKELKPEWKVLYRCDEQPVVIERSYGRGSIVLAADSFFVSNEALRRERHAQLLTRVFNGPSPVIFDEEHLGVHEDSGIVQLALKYRLHGVIAGLAVIAALSLWKSSVRFLPPLPDADASGEIVAGKDSAQGFSNLLRRSIKPADLLEACLREWRHGSPHSDRETALVEELAAREQARPPKQRNPVTAYRAIAAALVVRKKPAR